MTCSSGKHNNGLPRLFEDKLERFDNVLNSVEGKGLYSIPTLFESKSFHRSFGLPESLASGIRNIGKDRLANGASVASGNMGESCHSQDEHPRGGLSRDSSVEYIGIIRRTDMFYFASLIKSCYRSWGQRSDLL